MLGKYDSHSPVPTRTLGDISTGTEYPLPTPSPVRSEFSSTDMPKLLLQRSSETLAPRTSRPTYVALPSPNSFALDNPISCTPPLSTSHRSSPSASSVKAGSSLQTAPYALGLRVLVVDDDAITRTLMRRMLERLGCVVHTAENGEKALGRILGNATPTPLSESPGPILEQPPPDETRYNIVFLDNQMPVLSGVKTVARLRELGRRDFVVGVTGKTVSKYLLPEQFSS